MSYRPLRRESKTGVNTSPPAERLFVKQKEPTIQLLSLTRPESLAQARKDGVQILILCNHGRGRSLTVAQDIADTIDSPVSFAYGALGTLNIFSQLLPSVVEASLQEIAQFPVVVLALSPSELNHSLKKIVEQLNTQMSSPLLSLGTTHSYADILSAAKKL